MSLPGAARAPHAIPAADRLPIDTADRIAVAYHRRPPRYPMIPETAGLAIVLLVNRCTSPQRTLCRATPWAAEQVDEAVCAAAEAFTAVLLTGPPHGPTWRGGALASLRSLLGPALHGTPDGIWVDHESALEAVRTYLTNGPDPDPALDALVNCYRDNAGKLAAFNSLYERPADTRDLRASLAGDAAQGT